MLQLLISMVCFDYVTLFDVFYQFTIVYCLVNLSLVYRCCVCMYNKIKCFSFKSHRRCYNNQPAVHSDRNIGVFKRKPILGKKYFIEFSPSVVLQTYFAIKVVVLF